MMKQIRINLGCSWSDQTRKPLPFMTSIPGAGRKVVISSSISVCCKRVATGSTFEIAVASGPPAARSC